MSKKNKKKEIKVKPVEYCEGCPNEVNKCICKEYEQQQKKNKND